MSKKILNAASFGLLGGKGKSAPAATVPVMPLPDDLAVKAAKKRSLLRQLGRGGRSSTILTSDDSLGG